jgi:hypothetical protein
MADLIKQENTSILERQELHRNIVQSIVMGECTVPEDIVERFGITYEECINLFSNPNFTNLITKYSQAKLKMSFYGNDLIKLDKIIKEGDNKESLSGIKLKAQLTNSIKGTPIQDVNIINNFNLESLVKQSEKKDNYPVYDTEFERK